VKIDEGQQKIKIVRTNRQSNLLASSQSNFSLSRHLPSGDRTMEIGPIRNQNLIFWPLASRLVKIDEGQQKIKIVRTNRQYCQ